MSDNEKQGDPILPKDKGTFPSDYPSGKDKDGKENNWPVPKSGE